MEFKVDCSNCGHSHRVHDDNPSEHSRCHNCDSATLDFTVVVEETVTITDALDSRIQERDPNLSKTQAKKTWVDIKSGSDWWRDGGKFVYRYQEVNRKTDRYRKLVIDLETGKVVKDCDEPLSEYRK